MNFEYVEPNGQQGIITQEVSDVANEQTIFGTLTPSSQDPSVQFNFYRDQVLSEFNLTLGDYLVLPQEDYDQINEIISALWGYENGTLTKEEAIALTYTNSPRLFWGVWANPTPESLISHDTEEFRFSFSCGGSIWDMVTAVRAWVDTNPDVTVFSKSSSTVHVLTLEEIWDFWNAGYASGTNWYAYENNGIYLGWVDFNAVASGLPAASWVKIVIETEYKVWDLFKGWNTPTRSMTFSYNQIGQVFKKNIDIQQVVKPNPPPPIPPPVDSRKVLILVHGLSGEPSTFDSLYSSFTSQEAPQADRDYFQNTYKTTLYFTYLYETYGHVKSIGEALKDFIITHVSSTDTIDIIAHSLGGIVTRCFLKFYYDTIPESQRPNIGYVITCGSPHQGIYTMVPFVEYGLWRGVEEMMRFIIPFIGVEVGGFVRDELNSPSDVPQITKGNVPVNVDWYTLRGNNDFYGFGYTCPSYNGYRGDGVVPTEVCVLNDIPSDHNILVDGANHEGTISPSYIKAILGFPNYVLPSPGSAVAVLATSTITPKTDDVVQFRGEYSTGYGDKQITTYLWEFGDGSVSSTMNPTHEYKVPGTYTVTLTVMDDFGYSGTTEQAIDVAPSWSPTFAEFTAPQVVNEGQSVILDGSSTLNGITFQWDFGDGEQTEVQTTPITTHTYSTPGKYVVILSVSNDMGMFDEKRSFIDVRNVAPEISLAEEFTFEVGQQTSITPIISDPGLASEIYYTEWEIEEQTYLTPTLQITFDEFNEIAGKVTIIDSFAGLATRKFVMHIKGDDDVLPPEVEILYAPASIADSCEVFEITFVASDDSGISQVFVTLDDLKYPATYSEECFHALILNPLILGSHDLKITVIDGDDEYPEDLISTELPCTFSVFDDDDTPPILSLSLLEMSLNSNGGIDIAFDCTAFDSESGIDISSINIWIANQQFTSLGSHVVTIHNFEKYVINASVTNADLDRGIIDQEEGTARLDVNINVDLLTALILAGISDLDSSIKSSDNISWACPAACHKNAIGNKLADLQGLVETGQFSDAYNKLLYDVKPKLTGLKQDEYSTAWGSGRFNNPWVVDVALQGTFVLNIDTLLHALRWLAGGDPNPVGRLLTSALTEINNAQADIATIDCTLLRIILDMTVGGVESNLIQAWNLYGAEQQDWAAIYVKVADCLIGLSDLIVDIGNYFNLIEDQTATSLGGHFTNARTALTGILAIFDVLV